MIKKILHNMLAKKRAISTAEVRAVVKDSAVMALNKKIDRIFGRSVRIRQVDAGSCNACEWECTALTNPIYDIQRFGIDFVASPRHADILLVTGPVSRQMERALKKTCLATPEPRFVIACGDCAVDGGIYRDSYAVTNGVEDILPVDCRIPGCPPSPAAILTALLKFLHPDHIRAE